MDRNQLVEAVGFLQFKDWQAEVKRPRLKDTWTTVYDFHKQNGGNYATFCVLVAHTKDVMQQVLGECSWGVNVRFGYPGFWLEGDDKSIHYGRLSNTGRDIRYEPLVTCRSFAGRWPEYIELCEEFRLYHNLYHDEGRNEFIHLAESGEEDVVAKIDSTNAGHKAQIKTGYLRDFMAAKSVALVRLHDHTRYSAFDVTDALGKDRVHMEEFGDRYCFNIVIDPSTSFLGEDWKAFSTFLAKDTIPPFDEPVHQDYRSYLKRDAKQYASFIFEMDEAGNPVESTCNPDSLQSPAAGNVYAPHYLTPVFFKREVLKKYYEQPSKYSVEDNYLRCISLWGMRYGQNPSGFVHAWLGDLGRDLPYNEQLHWRQFNIPPEGGLGEATVRRELFGEFAGPDEITHVFKDEFDRFCQSWRSKLGWDLFLPLREDDEHYFKTLHIPTLQDPLEFDEQIQALAKILPDSINRKELTKLTGIGQDELVKRTGKPNPGSIDLLEESFVSYFTTEKAKAKDIVEPLRSIQSLRSAGPAHRRGDEYDRVVRRLGLSNEDYKSIVEHLFQAVIGMFRDLQEAAGIS